MSKARELKEKQVSMIADQLSQASAAIVVDYKGMNVQEVTELRNKFREANVEYRVYKNTLVRLAAKQAGVMANFDEEQLIGTSAFAISAEDPMVPAKIISDFMKTHPKLTFKMGYVEGEYYDAAQVQKLSQIPSKEELIAKLLGSFKAPVSNFVYLVDAIAKKDPASPEEPAEASPTEASQEPAGQEA